MSNAFRELLRKVGSGNHTGENLSRQEAEIATRMMLLQEATPAQIGAFMIAHRIKRPTGTELAGMLDAYDQLGPGLQPIASKYLPMILGSPYDGRSRTVPLSPITALILATVGCPTILHGGDRMPTKEGIPLIEVWQGLGVAWQHLTITEVQAVLQKTGLGFVYLPKHFPLASDIVPYRDQIGKRPPFATLELVWVPYRGTSHVAAGFVHPPTEGMFQTAIELRGTPAYLTTVKGLEGSCDLPRDRTAIIGLGKFNQPVPPEQATMPSKIQNPKSSTFSTLSFDRLLLHPRDYDLAGTDVPLPSSEETIATLQSVLRGEVSELLRSSIWNGGFYLWRCGACPDLSTGLEQAKTILTRGQAAEKLRELRSSIETVAGSIIAG
ncbi:MAG: anthranilate phosphoribosyltransferase family protein [Scytolyngbya sp. HA4215-MV1]|jgi:anthranilate phosphoribosyltransferase|nr:anthranilate phosphoribosyltransferase family protein [Scytolyngbya sp. HA4215-MV1]